ncbi:MAG TPA: cytochrome b [Gammaproteobacteria bacterium]
MQWRNSTERYGLVAIGLHWLVALTVFAMFSLGLWMTSLDYYHPWYHRAPALHKSIGVVLFALVVVRLLWRWFNRQPTPLPSHTRFERMAARWVHALLYLLLFAVMVAGYLISTADGRPIEVFGLLSIPATITSIPNQEDVAGDIHLLLAITLITLALLHAAAALKHHFVDRDNTLRRMLGR